MKNNLMLSKNVRPLPQYLDLDSQFASADKEAEVELREYFRVVFKYRLMIGAVVAIFGITTLIIAFLATPRYTAESRIRISTYEPILSDTKIEDVLQQKSREVGYIETQLQELVSYSLGDKVLEEPDIKAVIEGPLDGQRSKGGWFSAMFGSRSSNNEASSFQPQTGYKNPVNYIADYLDHISVQPVRKTSLVSILATHQSPAVAATMANAHARAYIDWVRVNRLEQQSAGLKFLKARAEELKEKVSDLEREMADYAEENSIVALNKDENITVQRMAQLNSLLTQASAERMETENTYKEALAALTTNSAGFDDTSIQSLRAQLASLEAEYGNLSTKFLDSYPKMQQLKAQIKNLRESVDAQRKQIVAGLKSKSLASAEKEKNIQEELEQQKSSAFELSKRQVKYNILNRELESSRELLQNVLKQIKETSFAVESNSSNVSIVDAAIIPRVPSFPKKKLMLTLGTLAGLGVGLMIAFLLNYLDNTIRTPEQVIGTLGLPALGVVPSFESEREIRGALPAPAARVAGSAEKDSNPEQGIISLSNAESNLPITFLSDPKSLASEAYRTIRTGVLLSRAGQPPRTILVTSAQSAEGKTTSAANLAVTLSSAGGNVVIIDADLRRPTVHKYFGLENSFPGLVEVITGQMTTDEVSHTGIVRRVSVIPAGRIPPNPAELLGSMEMANIIDKLSAEYDYVIIDSAPILPVTDSVILSRYVDGVVLVVKGGVTPKKVVKDAKDRLKSVGANILGAVLNNVDVTGGDYYYYSRYYYSYYSDENRNSGVQGAA